MTYRNKEIREMVQSLDGMKATYMLVAVTDNPDGRCDISTAGSVIRPEHDKHFRDAVKKSMREMGVKVKIPPLA